ncbi:dephospho-CoA kinase [Thiohalomonas denitrificans]|uniref:Dephospho-CoA kinase n=1 Tax=Thiohalomonas denitrificans TaxID=415747 RepID=A0A1G5PLW3_9GAMM|nr:dephospho-CoA kinase [Thiohalomonas denitrificans]SCZ50366.1 dephospho-CoA kinase [Thiohalomonas denitrificans]
MLRVGLTGGIGCGKSTVARIFADAGVPVIDTDIIAHELVAPGSPLLTKVVRTFGKDLLHCDGSLDRSRLREQVFADPDKRGQLESLLHPAIRDEMIRRAESVQKSYAILVIPLLVEKGWQGLVDRVLVVDCPPSLQLQRTISRDDTDERQARAILASQASREERLAVADDVIPNSGTLDKLRQQVHDLHRFYLRLAGN